MTAARRLLFASLMLVLGVPSLGAGGKDGKDAKEPDQVSYYKDVRPIFQLHCQGCHQPAKAQGGFVMTGFAELFKKGDHDMPGVVSGQPAKSMIVTQITPQQGKPRQLERRHGCFPNESRMYGRRWLPKSHSRTNDQSRPLPRQSHYSADPKRL